MKVKLIRNVRRTIIVMLLICSLAVMTGCRVNVRVESDPSSSNGKGKTTVSVDVGVGSTYANAEKYSIGSGSIAAEDIKEIEVNWVSGNLNVDTCDGDKITFTEDDDLAEDYQLRYLVDGSKLTIQFYKSGMTNIFSGFTKDIELQIPKSLVSLDELLINTVSASSEIESISADTLKIDNVSGDVDIKNATLGLFDFNTVSGALTAVALKADSIESSTVSGDVDMTVSVKELATASVSGKVKIDSDICPTKLAASTTSGDINIKIPDNDGFTATFDGVSGDMNCSFPTINSSDKYVYENGAASFAFATVSGDVYLDKR